MTLSIRQRPDIAAPPRRRRKTALMPLICGIVLVVAVIAAVFGPLLVGSHSATEINLAETFRPPVWDGGSWSQPLGTDNLGRDQVARLVAGARVSMLVGALSVLFAGVVGVAMGVISGYAGRWPDAVVSRIIDAQLSLPLIIVALGAVVALGPSLATVVFVISVTAWVPYAKVIRSEVLSIRERDYIALARVAGLRPARIVVRHVLVNVRSTAIVLGTLDFGRAIVTESGMSFLGLGVQPPQVSWGLMIADAQAYISSHPGLILIPSALLVAVALAANILGDWLRDRLDPTLELVK